MLGLVLTCVFQYFYFLLYKYWENSDLFTFTYVIFGEYFYFYLSKEFPFTCTFA